MCSSPGSNPLLFDPGKMAKGVDRKTQNPNLWEEATPHFCLSGLLLHVDHSPAMGFEVSSSDPLNISIFISKSVCMCVCVMVSETRHTSLVTNAGWDHDYPTGVAF